MNLRDERYQFLIASAFTLVATALICWLISIL